MYKILCSLFDMIILLLTGIDIYESMCNAAKVSVFNWDRDMVTVEKADVFFDEFLDSTISTVYQYIPARTAEEDIAYYLTSAAAHEVGIYLLTGEPEWGLEADGASMVDEIMRAQAINQLVPGEAQIRGVVMDVEPYLTDKWDTAPGEVMDRFAAGLACAYSEALDCGLQLIVCIPYFYDTKGYADALERIIESGCDRAAVMNYYKGKEADHIADEIALSRKYGKKLVNIYELQPPEGTAVTEANTYYHEGLGAVVRSAVSLRSMYQGDVEFAIHDFDAWKEMRDDE